MEIIPAVDIRGGKCVQLAQGDYARERVYNTDPVAAALEWQSLGATRLHVVDLDGARDGKPVNRPVVERIVAALKIPVEAGGGIRSVEDALGYAHAGVDRVILGTAAVEDVVLVQSLADALGDRLAIGIDARDGAVMTRGWLSSGHVNAIDLACRLSGAGVGRFIYTDISRDGMLQGPNTCALQDFIAAAGCPVIASGGISSVEHLEEVAAAGAEGAIVGTALYEGRFTLSEAQAALSRGKHVRC